MNNWQINALANLGNIVDKAGSVGASIYTGTQTARDALFENQANSLYNDVHKAIFDKGGFMDNAMSDPNLSPSDIADFSNYAKKNVWDKYATDSYLRQITDGKYSDEVYSKVMDKLNLEGMTDFNVMSSIYEGTAQRTLLESTFGTEASSNLREKGDDGNYKWMVSSDGGYAESGKQSAQEAISQYNTMSSGFAGFNIINSNGDFDAKGEGGRVIIAQQCIGLFGLDLADTKAMNEGVRYTPAMLERDIREYAEAFCEELGMDKDQTDALIKLAVSQASAEMTAKRTELSTNATNAQVSAIATMAKEVADNGYKSEAEIPLARRFEIIEQSGLGDWRENEYSLQKYDEIIQIYFGADMGVYNTRLMVGLEGFFNGDYTGELGFDLDSLVQGYMAGSDKTPVMTTFTVGIDEATVDQYGTDVLSESGMAMMADLYNRYGRYLEESEENNENSGLDRNLSFTTRYGEEVEAIAKVLGVTDPYAKVLIAQTLESNIAHAISSEGEYGQAKAILQSHLNNKNIGERQFLQEVDYYESINRITPEEAQMYRDSCRFLYDDEMKTIQSAIKLNVPKDMYDYAMSNPVFLNELQKEITAIDGKISGKDGDRIISTYSSRINSMFADQVTLSQLSYGLDALVNPDGYGEAFMSSLTQDYSVDGVTYDWLSGGFNGLGISFGKDMAIMEIVSKATSTSGKFRWPWQKNSDAESALQAIWEAMGFGGNGTYKKPNKGSEWKKEIVEKALLVGIAQEGQNKNMKSALGEDFTKTGTTMTYIDDSSNHAGFCMVSPDGVFVHMYYDGGAPNYTVAHIKDEDMEYIKANGYSVNVRDSMLEDFHAISYTETETFEPFTHLEAYQLNEYSTTPDDYIFYIMPNGRLGVMKEDANGIRNDVTSSPDLPEDVASVLRTKNREHQISLNGITSDLSNNQEFRAMVAKYQKRSIPNT